jgi:hypothetical protein
MGETESKIAGLVVVFLLFFPRQEDGTGEDFGSKTKLKISVGLTQASEVRSSDFVALVKVLSYKLKLKPNWFNISQQIGWISQ